MNEPIKIISSRLQQRIDSASRKRNSLGKFLRWSKFLRILFGVSSISFVSLSAFGEFSEAWKFTFTLMALASTSIATFSDELISAFGWSNRYSQNVGTLGALQNLQAELELELALAGSSEPQIDYWKYHDNLNSILNSGHKRWNTEHKKNGG